MPQRRFDARPRHEPVGLRVRQHACGKADLPRSPKGDDDPALSVATAVLLGTADASSADVAKCRRTIVGEFGKLAAARTILLRKCHDQVVKGKRPGPCPDAATALKLDAITGKLRAKINKVCGGLDRNCGIGGDDESLVALGWDIGVCPDFVTGGCAGAIADCNDVTACLACVGGAAVDQAMTLTYGAFVAAPAGSATLKCQSAIGKSQARFFATS